MQAAPGSVSWVAAQPSVLGRCGGGAPSASVKGRTGGGGGASLVARCCARAQEKRPPRVRKSKEERREMVESFINSYRVSNDGKFPSVNLTHKEVGGSYYIVREIVRDVIQENRVLGPGGLDTMALSFEDCPDPSEVSMKHELGEDNIEILEMSDDGQVGKGSVSESSSREESFSLRNNSISTETLLGLSVLEAGVLKSAVQNGSVAGTVFVETDPEKQDEAPSGESIEAGLNSSKDQDPSFAHVSDSDKDISVNTQVDEHEGMGSIVTDGVSLSSESTVVYETNGALLREDEALHKDSHGSSNASVVNDVNLLVATNGILQEKQASFQEQDPSSESLPGDDVQSSDGQFNIQSSDGQFSTTTTASANPLNVLNSEPEVTTKTVKASKEHSLQDELEQPLLDTSSDQQESNGSPVSHPASNKKGLLHTEDQHGAIQVDESEFKKTTSGVTKEEVKATDARHKQGMNTTTAISRSTLKALQKKDNNLFWLVLRAFVVAISKIWAK